MRVTQMLSLSVVLVAALPAFGFDNSSAKIGEKVVYNGDSSAVQGTIEKVSPHILFISSASITIKTDTGKEVVVPSDKYDYVWSGEGCDSQRICVGDTTYMVTVDGWGSFRQVVKAKLLGHGKESDYRDRFIGRIVESSNDDYPTGKIVAGYPSYSTQDGQCNSKNFCVNDNVFFLTGSYEGIPTQGNIVGLFGESSCSDQKSENGYMILEADGKLAFVSECKGGPVKIEENAKCDLSTNLCRGQTIYYQSEAGPILGYIEAANRTTAYFQVATASREIKSRAISDLGFTIGCMKDNDLCIGQKIFGTSTASLEIVGFFRGAGQLVVRAANGAIGTMDADNAYRQVGCTKSGFCVGQTVEILVSKQQASIVGINGEQLALKLSVGNIVDQIGFGWSAVDLKK